MELTNQEYAQFGIMRIRTLTLAGYALVAVGGAVGSVIFTFPRTEKDVSYIALATPSWNTTVYVVDTDKLTTQCTFTFGTASPGGGGTLNVIIMRTES